MSDSGQQLIGILFQALLGDAELASLTGGPKVFDRVPEKAAYPYVVVGRTSVSDWSTATEDGAAIVVLIHTWSGTSDRTQSHAIQQRIDTILTGELPPMAGYTLVQLRNQLTETWRDHTDGHLHGLMRFRALVEPAI